MSTLKHAPQAYSQSFSFANTFTPSPARPLSSQSSWLASNDQAATRRPSASERGAVGKKRRAESAALRSDAPHAFRWDVRTQNPDPRAWPQGSELEPSPKGLRPETGPRCRSQGPSRDLQPLSLLVLQQLRRLCRHNGPCQHPPRCPIRPPGATPLLQAPQPRPALCQPGGHPSALTCERPGVSRPPQHTRRSWASSGTAAQHCAGPSRPAGV